MGGLALLVFGFGAFFALFALKPRALWWTLSAWVYRNPEANEPSDAAYGLQSVVLGIAAVVCVIGGIALLGAESPEEQRERREQQSADCREIMLELEDARESGGVEAVSERARELGVEAEVREPAYSASLPDPENPEDSNDEVWIYDRDLPEDEQILGVVGRHLTYRSCA